MSVVVYHFWSPTCVPCNAIKPTLQDLKEDNPHINWISVNIQNDPNGYAEKLNVKSVPTVVATVTKQNDTFYNERHSGSSNMVQYFKLIRGANDMLKTLI